jgi:organic hydroperoxide reductase OsmC/OhrA
MMAGTEHRYGCIVEWQGNRGNGTRAYAAYGREHEIRGLGKPSLPGSADPAFRGDPTRWNPEELLVASLTQCHMLWYLHLAADAGIVVEAYVDQPEGTMRMAKDGSGHFTRVVLKPRVVVADAGDHPRAAALHGEAHARCFIANSVNFPVECWPEIVTA